MMLLRMRVVVSRRHARVLLWLLLRVHLLRRMLLLLLHVRVHRHLSLRMRMWLRLLILLLLLL
jgi:hypothetical protein